MTKNEKFLLRLHDDLTEFEKDFVDVEDIELKDLVYSVMLAVGTAFQKERGDFDDEEK